MILNSELGIHMASLQILIGTSTTRGEHLAKLQWSTHVALPVVALIQVHRQQFQEVTMLVPGELKCFQRLKQLCGKLVPLQLLVGR